MRRAPWSRRTEASTCSPCEEPAKSPVFAAVASCNDTRPGLALLLTALVLAGPAAAYFGL